MRLIAILFLITLFTGCVSTQYSSWEGDGIREGSGGVREEYKGVDFWTSGEPDRPYRIVGVIKDDRSSGLIQQAMYRDNITAKVKEVGGDGVIQKSKDENVDFMSGDNIFTEVNTVLYVFQYR